MALDDLKETIETLRERIQAHRAYLEGNETRTRQVLIDPMLCKLGWDVGDPNSIELEYGIRRKWADYALMGSGRSIAVIEAKVLGTPLNDDVKMQVLNYANTDGIDYMVVTDGDHWQMLDVFKRGRLEDRILMDFQLTRDEPYACALQALGLWRPNLASGKPKKATTPVIIKSSHDESVPSKTKQSSTASGIGQGVRRFPFRRYKGRTEKISRRPWRDIFPKGDKNYEYLLFRFFEGGPRSMEEINKFTDNHLSHIRDRHKSVRDFLRWAEGGYWAVDGWAIIDTDEGKSLTELTDEEIQYYVTNFKKE